MTRARSRSTCASTWTRVRSSGWAAASTPRRQTATSTTSAASRGRARWSSLGLRMPPTTGARSSRRTWRAWRRPPTLTDGGSHPQAAGAGRLVLTEEEAWGIDRVAGAAAVRRRPRAGHLLNFYLCNGGLVVPVFDDPNDEPALRRCDASSPAARWSPCPGARSSSPGATSTASRSSSRSRGAERGAAPVWRPQRARRRRLGQPSMRLRRLLPAVLSRRGGSWAVALTAQELVAAIPPASWRRSRICTGRLSTAAGACRSVAPTIRAQPAGPTAARARAKTPYSRIRTTTRT